MAWCSTMLFEHSHSKNVQHKNRTFWLKSFYQLEHNWRQVHYSCRIIQTYQHSVCHPYTKHHRQYSVPNLTNTNHILISCMPDISIHACMWSADGSSKLNISWSYNNGSLHQGEIDFKWLRESSYSPTSLRERQHRSVPPVTVGAWKILV